MISPVKIQENTNGSLQDLVSISDIIDFGSNTNGYYVRFADGTLLMRGRYSFTPSGDHYAFTINFPAEFIDLNYSVSVFPDNVPSATAIVGAMSVTTTYCRPTVYANGGGGTFSRLLVYVRMIAVGKWK